MKKILISLIAVVFSWSTPAFCVPSLQLDIGNGYYNILGDPKYDDETVISSGDVFNLYALMKESEKTSLDDTYYISMALFPSIEHQSASGSFSFEGKTISVTENMDFGTPAIPGHGVFPTWYYVVDFQFVTGNTAGAYNTQENTGEFHDFDGGADLYYAKFAFDTTGLDDNFSIHFDLYNNKTFAPFSHDAQSDPPGGSTSIPEPATILLFGLGLIGLANAARRKLKQ